MISNSRFYPQLLRKIDHLLVAALICCLLMLSQTSTLAQEPPGPGVGYANTPTIPGQIWGVHDPHRPRPPIVQPGGSPSQPPSDAVILFDGEDLDAWKKSGTDQPAPWKVEDGYFEVVGGTRSIATREKFGDIQLHLEFATPEEVKGNSQKRGNSGIIFMGRYEVQILDSFENDTYADGQLGALYGQYSPRANPAKAPGEWQSYDIVFEAPRFDGEELISPAKVTVLLNGVLLHHSRELIGRVGHKQVVDYKPHAPADSLVLQDHGNPVRFRNVWARKLLPHADPWLDFSADDDAESYKDKKVVLISGDEEYRSEEALPMLAQILSEKHGFDCKVLFAINPQTGTVDPNYSSNIPGLHHLEDADLVVIFTRFRALPDWQMKYIDEYFKRGGAFIALRTATHPFNFPKDSESKYKHWNWNSKEWPGGFGQQVFGETWVSHHGSHKYESTRGVIAESAANLPIVNGVKDVWGPTDVYGIAHLPDDATVLMYGQVLDGMNRDSKPVEGEKNDPMMPVAWTREYQNDSGTINRVFTTTMGASIDLQSEGLRRLIVNASHWCVGLEDGIPKSGDVSIRGQYTPTFFGFHNKPIDFFSKQLLTPKSYIVK